MLRRKTACNKLIGNRGKLAHGWAQLPIHVLDATSIQNFAILGYYRSMLNIVA